MPSSDSLQALLAAAVDYAGLFPPAQLSMTDAVRNYAEHRRSPHAWMLARFICPASRLAEFAAAATPLWNSDGAAAWELSVLGRGGETFDGFLAGLRDDLAAARAFQASFEARTSVSAFELRLPPDVLSETANRLREAFDAVQTALSDGPSATRPVFFEPGRPIAQRESVFRLAQELREYNGGRIRANPQAGPWGVKLRCGGTTPDAFPAAVSLASALAAVAPSVPTKFTAGLHHPFRHHNLAQNVLMHGFLNVLAAAALCFAAAPSVSGFDEARMLAMLEDQDPAGFAFGDGEFHWRSYRVTTGQIAAVRTRFALSFGSCSFDEPVEDLLALNLL